MISTQQPWAIISEISVLFVFFLITVMATTIDLTHDGTVLVAMESTAYDPHHIALPELSGLSSITSQVLRMPPNLPLHVIVLVSLHCMGVHRMSLLMDVSSSFEFFSEFVLSVRRSSTTMRTRFVSAVPSCFNC